MQNKHELKMLPLNEKDRWNFTLTEKEKRLVFWLCVFMGFLAWGGFSTPNTIHVTISMTKNIDLFGLKALSLVMGILLGLLFSISEILFIYMAHWKNKWFYLVALVCAGISISGTVVFIDLGHQESARKTDAIQSAKESVNNMRESLHLETAMITDYDAQMLLYQKKDVPIPGWLLKRKRQAIERKAQKDQQMLELQEKYRMVAENVGSFVRIKQGVSFISVGLALFVELLIFLFTIIGIGLRREANESVKPCLTVGATSETIEGEDIMAEDVKCHTIQILSSNALSDDVRQLSMSKESDNGQNHQAMKQTDTSRNSTIFPENGNAKLQDTLCALVESNNGKYDRAVLYLWDTNQYTKTEIAGLMKDMLNVKVSRQYVGRLIAHKRS